MSLFNNTDRLENPAKKFVDFNAAEDKGNFTYWDKEQKKNVEIPTPFYIMPVDTLATVTGYHAKTKSGIWSPEVRSTTKQPLVVRSFGSTKHNTKGVTIAEGLWRDIEATVTKAGGKYASSIYAVLLDKKLNPVELINIKLSKSSLNKWIDAGVSYQKISAGVVVKVEVDPTLQTEAPIPYYVPKFTTKDADADLVKGCLEVAKDLPNYHNQYFSTQKEENELQQPTEQVVQSHAPTSQPEPLGVAEYGDDNLPF